MAMAEEFHVPARPHSATRGIAELPLPTYVPPQMCVPARAKNVSRSVGLNEAK